MLYHLVKGVENMNGVFAQKIEVQAESVIKHESPYHGDKKCMYEWCSGN